MYSYPSMVSYLSQEYFGGTDMALSRNGVAAWRVKKEGEKQAEGGTEEARLFRAGNMSLSCGKCHVIVDV